MISKGIEIKDKNSKLKNQEIKEMIFVRFPCPQKNIRQTHIQDACGKKRHTLISIIHYSIATVTNSIAEKKRKSTIILDLYQIVCKEQACKHEWLLIFQSMLLTQSNSQQS